MQSKQEVNLRNSSLLESFTNKASYKGQKVTWRHHGFLDFHDESPFLAHKKNEQEHFLSTRSEHSNNVAGRKLPIGEISFYRCNQKFIIIDIIFSMWKFPALSYLLYRVLFLALPLG